MMKTKINLGKPVKAKVRGSVDISVNDSVCRLAYSSMCSSVSGSVSESVTNSVYHLANISVRSSVYTPICNSINNRLWKKL